jgi:hypothetical protein
VGGCERITAAAQTYWFFSLLCVCVCVVFERVWGAVNV